MRAAFARQLSHPHGLRGRVVAALLDRYNRSSMATAVEAMALSSGATAADLGFGGGAGLGLLLDRVGPAGQVYGLDVSATARNRAARRFRHEVTSGRLQLHTASMTDLPLPDRVLDGAMTFNTIYYIAELDRAFGELRRVLNDTGHAVVGLADPDAMAARSFPQHGLRLRPVDEITHRLREAGLALTEHHHLDHRGETFHLLVTCVRSGPAPRPRGS